jgi:hypothetical protein
MAAARSEGGGVELDGGSTLRGRRGRWRRCNNDQERRTDGLWKRMMVACYKDGVEAIKCFGAGDEAVACSRAKIEDGRWWWRHDGF